MPQPISKQIFLDALETMNRSIEANKNALFFRALLNACESLTEDDRMQVAIYRRDPYSPHDFYTIRMQEGFFEFVSHEQTLSDTDWRISEDYIRDLAAKPDKYINHPEKLSLNWLAERVISMTS